MIEQLVAETTECGFKVAEAISCLIKERIAPLPQFILKPLQEDDKNPLALRFPLAAAPYIITRQTE